MFSFLSPPTSHKFIRIFCLSDSAFEGIGTIVAIESSMRSPRKHFPRLIAVAISSVLVILCGFGTACYGYFGAETKQVITLNLSDGSHLVVALWSFILVSILLTFPLQVFPIFLAVEDVWCLDNRTLFLLRRAAITASCTGCYPATAAAAEAVIPVTRHCNIGQRFSVDAKAALIPRPTHSIHPGIAYMAQNSFAYVGAINGSVGCALLLFVIPSAIDLKLKEHATVKQPQHCCACVHVWPRFSPCFLQGSLLWWRCVVVALLGVGGGLFALKLSIQNIVG